MKTYILRDAKPVEPQKSTRTPVQRPNPPLERFIPNPNLKFMEQCREVMRFRRLALRSEQAK
ncbi:MAG TPA: hypothetical protein VIK53_00835 [Verrucomicrobiae bacterium]